MSTNPNNLVPIRSTIPGKNLPNRRELLWITENHKCHWCGRVTKLVDGDSADQATIDHVIPRYKGGTNDISNTVLACRGCNARKNTEDMKGLPDNSTLGKNFSSKRNKHKGVSLTGDEKNVIIGKHSAEDVLREQRDQALKEIGELRKELKQWEDSVAAQELEIKTLKSMSVLEFIRKKLADWINP